ncbi:MAG: ABC transporter ATP-binding protein [Candidatus Eisenbacteria bacterium]|uniref:ABC transporter ATP-binding protein n=1 Tax=Eiseniibacteriota bacterium TaxID=2212470 RepID=A0A849SA72_UNCEI|nr:ABC transporter ATP-binding protein [Candidatus Eisenbacteria bacterium]
MKVRRSEGTVPEVAEGLLSDRNPDATLAVETRGLWKSYRHPWTMQVARGIEDLNLEVRRGEVMGYLGPNGAGKTTTLKVLTGLHKPSTGMAWILGRRVEDSAARQKLGFLPEQPYFYDYLNGVEYLELVLGLSGISGRDASQRARHWLGRVGLGDKPRVMLRKYSKGMLQRIGLAGALAHDPELLILDEPMSGLDPFGRRDVRELILEQRARGVTVLFSSHILPDVEMLCDRVAIVLQGRLQRVATVAELMDDGRHSVEIRLAQKAMIELPLPLAGVLSRRDVGGETRFVLSDESRTHEVLAWLQSEGLTIRALTPQRPSLEEMFMATAEQVTGTRETSTRRSA